MEWFDNTDFENLENVVQAYGFIFDKEGKLCIVDCNKGYWCLPGGTLENYDKSFEDTLIREVDEEADLDIKNIKRVGYFKVTPISDNCEREKIHYLLRYVAEVDKIKNQTIDPANGKISLRKFIRPEEFSTFIDWENGVLQLKKAIDVFKK